MTIQLDPHDDENWRGGYYEAAMVLGRSDAAGADDRLARAIGRLWSHSSLQAAALGDRKQWNWGGVGDLSVVSLESLSRLYGVFRHSVLGPLPFTSVTVREDAGDDGLYACVPLGGVRQAGAYPFGDNSELIASRSWREPLENGLTELVLHVCRAVEIQIAAIGFEVSGTDFDPSHLERGSTRYVGYVVRNEGEFRVLPTTHWA